MKSLITCHNLPNTVKHITRTEYELLEMIMMNDIPELAKEIILIHDIALYHSDYSINEKEKNALFQLKQLSEIINRIAIEI